MKIYKIYKIKNNINGKIYIGFTSKGINYRFRCHCYSKKNTRITKAIKKYGKHNFSIEWICSSLDKDYALNILEPYFIQQYKCLVNNGGYNLCTGGQGISYHTLKTKRLLSKKRKELINSGWVSSWKGRKHSEEAKKRIGVANSNKSLSTINKLKKSWTKERREKLSLKMRGKNNPSFGKHINFRKTKLSLQERENARKRACKRKWEITKPDGKIEIISNLKQYCELHNLNPGNMRAVAVGLRKKCKGYSCRYADK